KLLADTGNSGLVVNSSAVNIPSSATYSSYTLISMSGVMVSATVCLNPSITNSCVVMPIGLLTSTSDSPFPANGEPQGDFGLASIPNNSLDIGYDYSSGSSIIGYSYATYLEMQHDINSYTISFYSLTNGYYSNVSSTTPIGWISFGVYNGNSNTLISYTMNPNLYFPSTTVVFPSSNSSTPSYTGYAVFNTGFNYNYLSTEVFQTEIPNFSQSADENACASYTNYGFPHGIVNGGYSITYLLQNNSGNFYSGSFTTEPSLSFCEAGTSFNLMEGITVDYGDEPFLVKFLAYPRC
ncbi:MAG: Retroviral aspartyl protease, partial [Hydrogenobaculum sp.]